MPGSGLELRSLDPSSPSEFATVLALVKTVYGFDMSEAFYRWRFLDSPFGAPLVSLLWDGDVLAGHYAASPMRAWVDGAPLAAAQSMTTMTHPSYRNRGVFTDLARDLYARMEARGIGMIWGLPNTQSHYGFVAKLGWRDVGVVFTMTRALGDADRTPSDGPELRALREQPGAPADDALLARCSPGDRTLASVRDATYLRWRYTDNPLHRYRYFATAAGAHVIAKQYAPRPELRALELVETLHPSDPKALAGLVRALIALAAREGFTHVRTWLPVDDPAFGELEKLGFTPREPLSYFGARTFGTTPFPAAPWRITMGDSDNY